MSASLSDSDLTIHLRLVLPAATASEPVMTHCNEITTATHVATC